MFREALAAALSSAPAIPPTMSEACAETQFGAATIRAMKSAQRIMRFMSLASSKIVYGQGLALLDRRLAAFRRGSGRRRNACLRNGYLLDERTVDSVILLLRPGSMGYKIPCSHRYCANQSGNGDNPDQLGGRGRFRRSFGNDLSGPARCQQRQIQTFCDFSD